jgi:hypothetical protein
MTLVAGDDVIGLRGLRPQCRNFVSAGSEETGPETSPSQATGRVKRRDNHLQMLRIALALVVDLCCAKLSKGAERLDHRLLCQYPVNHSRRLRSASWRGFLRLSPVSCPDLPLCSDDAHEIHPPAPKSRSRFQQV